MTSFYFHHLFKDSVSKYSHILNYRRLGLQCMDLGQGSTECFSFIFPIRENFPLKWNMSGRVAFPS